VRRSGRCWITGNSSKIVQLQNLYRPKIKDPETAVDAFATRDLEWLKALYSDVGPMKVLASCIRSMLIAADGHDLIFPDYSGIEARGNAWLWGEHWKLDAFRAYDAGTGPNVYKLAYAKLFSVPVESVTDDQQQVGKVIDLSSGYGGGVSAFVKMAKTYELDLPKLTTGAYAVLPYDVREEAQSAWGWAVEQKRTLELDQRTYVVCDAFKRLWRGTHPGITAGWRHLENAMISAITNPGQVFPVAGKKLMFKVQGDWLYMRLPSGRRLAYYKPQYDETRGKISYMGVDTATRRWCRTETYGGRADENGVQGICRDVLANAKLRLEARKYFPVGSVHDEPVLEVPEGSGSVDEAAAIMCEEEPWAVGLPLAVKGHRAKRYRK
jgi:DNA polymerase